MKKQTKTVAPVRGRVGLALLAVLATSGCAGQVNLWPLSIASNQGFSAMLSSCYSLDDDGAATSDGACWLSTGSVEASPVSSAGLAVGASQHRGLASAAGEIGRK